jgi:hypothetical protein
VFLGLKNFNSVFFHSLKNKNIELFIRRKLEAEIIIRKRWLYNSDKFEFKIICFKLIIRKLQNWPNLNKK